MECHEFALRAKSTSDVHMIPDGFVFGEVGGNGKAALSTMVYLPTSIHAHNLQLLVLRAEGTYKQPNPTSVNRGKGPPAYIGHGKVRSPSRFWLLHSPTPDLTSINILQLA